MPSAIVHHNGSRYVTAKKSVIGAAERHDDSTRNRNGPAILKQTSANGLFVPVPPVFSGLPHSR